MDLRLIFFYTFILVGLQQCHSSPINEIKESVSICDNNVCVAGKIDGPDGKCSCCLNCLIWNRNKGDLECPLRPKDCGKCIDDFEEPKLHNGGTLKACTKIKSRPKQPSPPATPTTPTPPTTPTTPIPPPTDSKVVQKNVSKNDNAIIPIATVIPGLIIILIIIAGCVVYAKRKSKKEAAVPPTSDSSDEEFGERSGNRRPVEDFDRSACANQNKGKVQQTTQGYENERNLTQIT